MGPYPFQPKDGANSARPEAKPVRRVILLACNPEEVAEYRHWPRFFGYFLKGMTGFDRAMNHVLRVEVDRLAS
jgi:hypothetical protein